MDLHDKNANWHLFTIALLLLFLGLLKRQSYLSYYPPFTPVTLLLSLLKDLNEENLPKTLDTFCSGL